jgi:hypothetical protein
MKLTITPVDAIGRERGFGHKSDGTPIYEWEIDIFPPSPNGKKLRELRNELDLGLRESAKALGISATDLSSLEHGRATCAEWEELFQALREVRRA